MPPEPTFDDLAALAAGIVGTPIALTSLVDATRQAIRSAHGLGAGDTSRDVAFCAHAILQNAPLIAPDARVHERFDAVLVDGDAGGLDAFALTGRIRVGENQSSGIPIVALSAGPLDGERDQCIRADMGDLLSLTTLGRDLEAALRRLTT